MNTFHIKLLAISTMLLDHIGAVFFPQIIALRVIGRLSFPLFAWLIANGAYHTKNETRYAFRLLIFALISQIPYMLLFHSPGQPVDLNVFFTLFLGLCSIILLRQSKMRYLTIFCILLLGFMAHLSRSNYGFVGVLSVTLFYVYYRKPRMQLLSQGFLYGVVFFVPFMLEVLKHPSISYSYSIPFISEPLAVLSVCIIWFYNKKEGPKYRYFFYLFYPAHLLVLWGIKTLFT